MNETVIHARMTRAQVRNAINDIPAAARRGGAADAIFKNAGEALLSRIYKAFIIKSQGGTDECGERWVPLAPATIAKRLRKLRPTREQDRPSSALSFEQKEKWWACYRSALAKYKDKSTAAKIAWSLLKHFGIGGHFDKYGSTWLNILRDSEELLRSLSPKSSSIHQIFRIAPGKGEVGTNRRGALANHKGGKNLPQRRLWPPPQKWTSAWWQEVLEAARLGVIQLIVEKLK